jgi:hypothetical protein
MLKASDTKRAGLNVAPHETTTPSSRALTPTADEALFADVPPSSKLKRKRKSSKKSIITDITPIRSSDPVEVSGVLYFSAAVLWLAMVASYHVGFLGPEGFARLSPLQWAELMVVALAPVAFIALAANMTRTTQKLQEQARAAAAAAERLTRPDFAASEEVATLGALIRGELSALDQGLERTIARLGSLERDVTKQAQSLHHAARDSQTAAIDVTERLSKEREAMGALVKSLDEKVAMIAEAIATQSRMVADACDLADTQMRDATTRLGEQASQLTGAFRTARDTGAEAAESAEHNMNRLREATRALEMERTAMESALARITDRQDHILKASAESRAGQEQVVQQSEQTVEAFMATISEAVEQAKALSQMAERERAVNESTVRSAIVRLEDMAEQARKAAHVARLAVEEQADSALKRIESLGEATFELTARTDQTLENQLNAARKLVERSASTIDEAASRVSHSLDAGLAGAKARLDTLEAELSGLSEKLQKLPDTITAQTGAVREALTAGLRDIHAEVRAAAEDARTLESEVDGRIKTHTDMLSDMAGQLTPLQIEKPQNPMIDPVPSKPEVPGLDSLFSEPPPSPAPASKSQAGDWTWKELLNTLENNETSTHAHSEPVLDAIKGMGITVRAALPDALMRTLATQWQDQGLAQAITTVRRSAPASVRKIANKIKADTELARLANHYVVAYGDILNATRTAADKTPTTLLDADAARAFWLMSGALDAQNKG